jgi:Histidine kinase-, DNA gyrase B-, and HSP90-like ATPase
MQNQLFQPFSQENPLQPGTGLGLAIVNSIVRSESVSGKIDVWSSENIGTEIRIIFEAQVKPADPNESNELGDWRKDGFANPPSISLLGFNESRGHKLLKQVLTGYLEEWWHFNITSANSPLGDILVLNEEVGIIRELIGKEDCLRPLVVISSARGDPYLISTVDDYERAGGFARIIFKPVGPSAFQQVLRLCVRIVRVGLPEHHRATPSRSSLFSIGESSTASGERHVARDLVFGLGGSCALNRRRSDGNEPDVASPSRPTLPPRSRTYNLQVSTGTSTPPADEHDMDVPNSPSATISVGSGGLLLKTSVGSLESGKVIHVLVVEDNNILRELLYVQLCCHL